jgi:hypothetical protein
MTLRERFIESMIHFRSDICPPKWEFGYWGETVDNWYGDGLVKKDYPKIPKQVSTPIASLYNPAWNSISAEKLPSGIAVTGGAMMFPTQSFPMDNDIRAAVDLDKNQILVNVNLLFQPMFDLQVLENDEKSFVYVDIDGIKRKFVKDIGVIPTSIEWVIKDWKSWNKLKDERLNPLDIRSRFPRNWEALRKKYDNRDYPLVLGGYPCGYFGTLAHLLGYENLFYMYYDDPRLIHDIQKTFTELWINIYTEILSEISVDCFFIWEDVSAGSGSMISPSLIREFMLPYYKKLTDFLRAKGIRLIVVDTDGDCFELIPLFLEAGINALMPIEVSCGMDLLKVRKSFPTLRLMGGFPKYEIKHGKQRIDQMLGPIAETLKSGGYIPFCDHLIPPEIPWADFRYYRTKLNHILEESAAKKLDNGRG